MAAKRRLTWMLGVGKATSLAELLFGPRPLRRHRDELGFIAVAVAPVAREMPA